MQIVVLANTELKEELMTGLDQVPGINWISKPGEFKTFASADAWIDLLFEPGTERTSILKTFSGLVCINSVSHTLENVDASFIRINGWRTFLRRPIIEASVSDQNKKQEAEKIFALFNREVKWLPDEPGFVSAKVISMIINEAYFALEEGVSTKADIDTAMKLGTNYPYGPFEWAELIGIKNIYTLLTGLSKHDDSYQPAPALVKEAK